MSGSEVKVEVLTKAVKSLQQERSCLDKKLQELRKKRGRLESSIESVHTKLRQKEDCNVKMKETLKVAQHKVSQTQTQLNKLKYTVTAQQGVVDSLKKNSDKEQQFQLERKFRLDEELAQLSDQFLGAKDSHTAVNLETSITETTEKGQNVKGASQKQSQEAQQLTGQFQQLKIQQESRLAKAEQMEIPPSQQKFLMEIFASERALQENLSRRSQQRIAQLQAQLTKTQQSQCQ